MFPYHKCLPRVLESAADKPVDLMTYFHALLDEPSGGNAKVLFHAVRDHHDWGVTDLEAYTWFMTDVEWSWMSGRPPLENPTRCTLARPIWMRSVA